MMWTYFITTSSLLLNVLVAQSSQSSSLCVDDTPWNTHNVAKELKQWISSLENNKDPDDLPTDIRVMKFPSSGYLRHVGNFDPTEGPTGVFWMSNGSDNNQAYLNGFTVGSVNRMGEIEGRAAFVYPDFETVYVGIFARSKMVKAQASKIVAERCLDGVKVLKFALPKESEPFVNFFKPTETSIGGLDTYPDPYERKTVYIKDINSESQGVFARGNLKKGDLINYYGGLLKERSRQTFTNITLEERFKKDEYLMVTESDPGYLLDTPSRHLYKYRATLGHKVNHAFKNHNANYTHVFHPRMGPIVAHYAIRDIQKGEEILSFYNYHYEEALAPKWYYEGIQRELGPLSPEAMAFYQQFLE